MNPSNTPTKKSVFLSPVIIGLVVLGGLLGFLSSCKPPTPDQLTQQKLADSEKNRLGKAVISVQTPQKPLQHHYTEALLPNGDEVIVSPYPVGQFGGTLLEASLGTGPKTFNPWESRDATSGMVGGKLTCSLISTDPYTGESIPSVAKKFVISPDQKTITVTLRKGLNWSDNTPLTAHDVLFTWNTIIKEGLGNPSLRDVVTINGQFPTVQQIDDYTLKFTTPTPFAPFLTNLGQAIAPAHYFEPLLKQRGKKAFSQLWSTQEAEQHPEHFPACGAWQLEHYEPGQRVQYKRNPHYFMVNTAHKRLPYVEKEVVTFAKDENNLLLQFEQGQVHALEFHPPQLNRLRYNRQLPFSLYDLGANDSPTFVVFNLSKRKTAPPNPKPWVDPTKSAWFNTLAFRQAVDWAVDRQGLVSNVLRGIGQPLFTAESLNSVYLNKTLAKGHPQDIEKAKALLKTAGFSWNAQQKLLDANGVPVTFTLLTNAGNAAREATGVQLKQDLEKLGIAVQFKPMEFNTLVDKLHNGQWEAIILGLSGGGLEPNGAVNVWRSTAALHFMNFRPEGALPSPDDRLPWEKTVDTAFDEGVKFFDREKRRVYYDAYQRAVSDQLPMIYLYSGKSLIAIRSELQNLDITPLGGAFHNVESLWLKQSEKDGSISHLRDTK